MVSVVENELFSSPSILALACATSDGDRSSRNPAIAAAATPAPPAAVMNARRFRYRPLEVISVAEMSEAFFINISKNLPNVRLRYQIGFTLSGKCDAYRRLEVTKRSCA